MASVNVIKSRKIVKLSFCSKILKWENDGTDNRKIKYKKTDDKNSRKTTKNPVKWQKYTTKRQQ